MADTYVSAVWAAGGLPLIIPPRGGDDPPVLDRVLDSVDGLLFVGGADLDPLEYGQQPHELLEETSHVRDSYELPLIRRAFERDVPDARHLPWSAGHERRRGRHPPPGPARCGLLRSPPQRRPPGLDHHIPRDDDRARVTARRASSACDSSRPTPTTTRAWTRWARRRRSWRMRSAMAASRGWSGASNRFAVAVQWHPETAEDGRLLRRARRRVRRSPQLTVHRRHHGKRSHHAPADHGIRQPPARQDPLRRRAWPTRSTACPRGRRRTSLRDARRGHRAVQPRSGRRSSTSSRTTGHSRRHSSTSPPASRASRWSTTPSPRSPHRGPKPSSRSAADR